MMVLDTAEIEAQGVLPLRDVSLTLVPLRANAVGGARPHPVAVKAAGGRKGETKMKMGILLVVAVLLLGGCCHPEVPGQENRSGKPVPLHPPHDGVFRSELPPHGSLPVRYDVAHELRISAGRQSAVVQLGLVSGDGTRYQSGTGTVTETSIPLVSIMDGRFRGILFLKEAPDE